MPAVIILISIFLAVFLLYAVPLPRVSNFGAIFSEDDSGYPQRDYYENKNGCRNRPQILY